MKIYGHILSMPTNTVRLAASALGHAFDFEIIDLSKGENGSPEYLAINPVGKIPALDDNGFQLFESHAITRYLGRKADSSLYPSDPQKVAPIDQWMDFSYNHVLMNTGKIFYNKIVVKAMGREPNVASIKEGQSLLARFLPIVEKQLSDYSFLAGDELSLADVTMIAAMEPFEFLKFDLSEYPNIVKWRHKIMAQDFYQNVHAHFGAELPPRS